MSKRRHRRDSNKKTTKGQFWSDEEHRKFVEGVAKFGAKAVNDISDYVGTRTPVQVRSHAQKYFIRLARDEAAKAMADETDKDKADERPSPDMVHALMNARLRERAALKKHKSFEHITNSDGHGDGHHGGNGDSSKGGITAVFTAGGHTGQSVVPLTPEAVREAKRQRHALHVAQRKRRQARKARLAATAAAATAMVTVTTAAAASAATGASTRTGNDDEKNEEDDNTHDDNDDVDSSSSNHSDSDSDSNYSDHDHDDDDDDDNNGTKSYKRRRMNHTKTIGDAKGHYKKAASRKLTTRKNNSTKDDNNKENDNGTASFSSSLSVVSSSCMSGGKVKPLPPVSFNHDHDSNGDIGHDNDIKLKYESSSWPSFSMPAPRPPYGMSINIDAPSTLTAPLRNGNGATCVRVHSPGVSLPHLSQLVNDTVTQEPMISTPVKPVLSLPSSSSPSSSSPPSLSLSSMSSPMSTSVCSCSDATPPNFPPTSIYHHPNYHRADISSPSPLPLPSAAAPLMTINPNSNHAPLSRQLLSPLAPFRASPLSVPPVSLLSCTVHGVDADPSHSNQNPNHDHHGSHPPLVPSLPLSMIRMPLSSLPRSEPVPIAASRTPMMAAARIQPFWPIGDHNGNSNKVGSESIVKQEKSVPASTSIPMVKGMGIASGLLSTPSMATIGRDSPMASMRSSLFPSTKMVPTRDIHARASATSASSSTPVPVPPAAGAVKTKVALKAKERSSSSSSSTSAGKSLANNTTRKPKVSRSSITIYDDNDDGKDHKRAMVQPKARGVTSTKTSIITPLSSTLTSTSTAATTAIVSHDNDNDDTYTPVQYTWLPRDVYTNGDAIDRRIDDNIDYNDDDNHGVDDGSQTKERTKHERTHSRVVDQRYEIPTNGDSHGNSNGIMLYRVRWCTTMISRPSAIWFYSPSCRRRCDKYESIRHLATSKWPISTGGTGGYRPSSPPSKVPHGNGNGNGMSDSSLSSDPPSSPDTDGSTSSSLSSSALSMPTIAAVTGERRRCRQLTGDIPRIIPSDVNQSAGRIIGTSHTRGGRRRQAWHVIWQDTWEPIQLLTRDIHRHWTVHCKQHGLPVPPPFGMDPDHTAAVSSSTSASSSSSTASGSSLRRSNDSKSKKRYRNDTDTGTKDGNGNGNGNGNGVDGDSNASIITHKRIQKATHKVLAMTSFGSLPSSNRASQSQSQSSGTGAHRRASSNPTYDRSHGHVTSSIANGNGHHHRTLSAPNIPTLNGTLVNDGPLSLPLPLPSSSSSHGHGDNVSNYFHLRFHDHGASAGYPHTNGQHAVNIDATSLSHRPLHHSQPYMRMATNQLSSSNGSVDAVMAIDNHQAHHHHHQPHASSMIESPRMVMRTSPIDALPSLPSPMMSTSHDSTPHHMHAVGILTPQRSWPSTPYASPSPSSQKQHRVGHNNASSTIDHDTSLSLSSSSSSSLSHHNQYGTSEVDGFLADLSPIPLRDASMMAASQHQHEQQQQQRRVHDAAMTTPRPSVPSSQLSASSLSSLQLSPIACVTTEMNHDTRDTSLSFTCNNMKENEHDGNNAYGNVNNNSSNSSGNSNSSSTCTSFRAEVTPSVGSNGLMHGHRHASAHDHGHGHGVSFSFSVSSISS